MVARGGGFANRGDSTEQRLGVVTLGVARLGPTNADPYSNWSSSENPVLFGARARRVREALPIRFSFILYHPRDHLNGEMDVLVRDAREWASLLQTRGRVPNGALLVLLLYFPLFP